MLNHYLSSLFRKVSTPLIADACLSLNVPLRFAPSGIRPVLPGYRIAGHVLPVRHYGSVDIFLEALGVAETGDVMVIDNAGRLDEGCIGDLIALEAQAIGLSGIAVWGAHRDTAELEQISLPVFSYGTCPVGPRRLDTPEPDALTSARFGDHLISREDIIFADLDGVLFVSEQSVDKLMAKATSIWRKEREQAQAVRTGRSLREQFQFDEYLFTRNQDTSYTFRMHLRTLDSAIEE